SFFKKIPIQRMDNQTGFSGSIHEKSLRQLFSMLKFSKDKPEVFLDCGCGEGSAIIPLSLCKTLFSAVIGIDHNPLALHGLVAFVTMFPELGNDSSTRMLWWKQADLLQMTSLGSVTIAYI